MGHRTRLLLATLALVVGTALLSAVPAQAKPVWAPEGGATFNVPEPWGQLKQRYRIVHKVERAIRNAAPNSGILVTSYLMDRWQTTDALIAACRRGVHVRVILDGDVVGRPAKKLINYLNADNRVDVSRVTSWEKVKPKKSKKHKKAKPKRRMVVKLVRDAARRGPCNTITPARRQAIVERVTERFRAEQASAAQARARKAEKARERREAREARQQAREERRHDSPAARKKRAERKARWERRWKAMSKAERRQWRERREATRAERRREAAQQRKARAERRAEVRQRRRAKARRELAQRRHRAIARAQRPLSRQVSLGRARRMAHQDLSAEASWGPDGSYVKMCSDACRSDHGAMHTKFFAFSRTGRTTRVVMVSSSNLNKGGAAFGWNDMWTMRSAPEAYERYRTQHRAMTREARSTRGGIKFMTKGGTRHTFYPRLAGLRRTDPAMRDLQRIGCATRHRGKKLFSRVHVGMFWWSGRRGMALADQLVRLGRRGCHVNVIVGAPSRKVMIRLRAAAQRGHILLYDSRWDFWGDDLPDVRSHSKSVLVRGRYGRERWASRVFTGSANFTGGGLQFSDENTIMLTYPGAYDSYLANWKKIRRHSRRYAG